VIVFDSEKSAYEGLSDMKELHKEGSISLYSTAVLAKDAEGVVEIKQATEKGPVGTAIGMAELEAEYKARAAKLEKAWELTKDAMSA
ncbi:MAG: hypothetical protein U9Q75_02250, partial [Pseudomonadota bacterium]|nr:hypothetical protein [Pseudomonadota bacterium]